MGYYWGRHFKKMDMVLDFTEVSVKIQEAYVKAPDNFKKGRK